MTVQVSASHSAMGISKIPAHTHSKKSGISRISGIRITEADHHLSRRPSRLAAQRTTRVDFPVSRTARSWLSSANLFSAERVLPTAVSAYALLGIPFSRIRLPAEKRGEGGSARVYRVGEIRDGGFGPERHRSSAPAISQYRTSLPHARQETGNHVRKQKKRRGRPDSEGKARHAQKAAHGRPNCGAKKNTRRQRAQAPAQKTIETASAYYARIVEGGSDARVVAPNFNERAQGRSGPSGKPRRVYSGSDFVWPLFKSSSFC